MVCVLSLLPLVSLALAAPSNLFLRNAEQQAPIAKAMDTHARLQQLETIRSSMYGSRTQSEIPADLGNSPSEEIDYNARILAQVAQADNTTATSTPGQTAGCTNDCQSTLSFAGDAAKKYAVGTQIPSLPFKTKNSWAGNMPISSSSGKDSSLYFWLWGKDQGGPEDDLVIWLNGGPGCSSLGGMTQENGPWLYESVKAKPYPNQYSWTRAANMLYVEQPVGTGFSTGVVTNTNEEQVAADFASFLDNFFQSFPELNGKKLYVTGESYAGQYIPYLLDYQYKNGNKHNILGAIIIDGVFTDESLQSDLPALDYAIANQKTIGFTDDDISQIKAKADQCKYTGYLEANLVYPPKGKLPDYNRTGCDSFNTFYTLALKRKSDFNVYRITTPDPSTNSPLGNPNGGSQQNFYKTFFDNSDLQTYIHAPHKKWNECNTVFVGQGDQSLPPDQTILSGVIENSKKFMIMQGQEDALIITNGSSLALQNLTWNDGQGFSKPPSQALVDLEGKNAGVWQEERNLIYAIVEDSGHMIPGDAPASGLAALEVLLGQRPSLSG